MSEASSPHMGHLPQFTYLRERDISPIARPRPTSHRGTISRRIAAVAASVRDDTPNLPRMLET